MGILSLGHVNSNQTVQNSQIGVVGDYAKINGGIHLHGIPPKAFDRLLRTLDEKDVALENRDKIIGNWKKRYQELEDRLENRSSDDRLIDQAKEKLKVGDLDCVEKLLTESFEKKN